MKKKLKTKQKPKLEVRKSAGIIVFRKNKEGKREYLLLEYGAGKHWDYAKGGISNGEDEKQAALRELREETGLTQVEFVDGFKKSLHYFFREGGALVSKTVVFFLAQAPADARVKLSFEHSNYAWLSFEKAVEKATYSNAKQVLRSAEEFLKNEKQGIAKKI
ncbi:MAG: NUDIX domain-containing protein [Candidatus Norongarragalinales archaeon]